MLVSALAVIDTLIVTQNSLEEIHQRSIGCSSKADKIYEEYEERVEMSNEVYILWTFEKKEEIKNIKDGMTSSGPVATGATTEPEFGKSRFFSEP